MEGIATHKRRRDGRTDTQLRPLSIEFGVLHSTDGSARFSIGDTKVLVGVQGPRPPRSIRTENPDKAVLEVLVQPSSGPPGAAEAAIEAAVRSIFGTTLVLSAHPRTVLTLVIQVIQDSGSLLPAVINAVTLALADAGVPAYGLVAAAACGLRAGDHAAVVDLTSEEEPTLSLHCTGATISTSRDGWIFRQQSGAGSEEVMGALDASCHAGCDTMHSFMTLALRKKVEREVAAR